MAIFLFLYHLFLMLCYRNVLQVTTETPLACFWVNVSHVTVTDTRTSVWAALASVWWGKTSVWFIWQTILLIYFHVNALSVRTVSTTRPETTVRNVRAVSSVTTLSTDSRCPAPAAPVLWASPLTSQYHCLFDPLVLVCDSFTMFSLLCLVLQKDVCRRTTGCSVCVRPDTQDLTVKG